MDTVLHAGHYVCNIIRENLNIPGQDSSVVERILTGTRIFVVMGRNIKEPVESIYIPTVFPFNLQVQCSNQVWYLYLRRRQTALKA